MEADTPRASWSRVRVGSHFGSAAAVTVALLLAGVGQAQPPQPDVTTWHVKFVCGQRPPQQDWNAVAPGNYYTAINLLNSTRETARVATQISTTTATVAGGIVTAGPAIVLQALQAAELDCADILRASPSIRFLKGFVSVSSATPLAITAVYTAANASGVASIDVEQISAVSVPRCPDLTIAAAGRPTVDVANGRTTVVAAVKNIGTARAPATTAQVEDPNRSPADPLRIAEANVQPLDPNATRTVDLVLNYVVSGSANMAALVLTVDPKDTILECREDNNRQTVGAP